MTKPLKVVDITLSEDGTKLLGVIKASKSIASDLGVKIGEKVHCVILDVNNPCGSVISKEQLKNMADDWKKTNGKKS